MGPTTAQEVATDSALFRGIRPTFGYYRQPNGWITVSPITRLERVKYQEEGWEHLGKYGQFDMSPYVANHPLEALFMFGGAHELPVEQIIEMGLHLNPPLVPTCRQHLTQFHRAHTRECWVGAKAVVFPQLAQVPASSLEPFPCEFCERILPTAKAREQHQSVAHKENLANIKLGKVLGGVLKANPSGVPVSEPPSAEGPRISVKRHKKTTSKARKAK